LFAGRGEREAVRVWLAFLDRFLAALATVALVQTNVFPQVSAVVQLAALVTLPSAGTSFSLQLATAVLCRGGINSRAVSTSGSIMLCSVREVDVL
jgi:hypothetical protein